MRTAERLRALDRRVLGPYQPLTLTQVRNLLVVLVVGALWLWHANGAGSALPVLLGGMASLTVRLFAETRRRSDPT